MRIVLGLVLVGALAPGAARTAEFEHGDLRGALSASLKSIYTFSRATRADDFVEDFNNLQTTRRKDTWSLLNRARVTGEAVWQDRVYAQVVYDNEVRTGTQLDSLGFAIAREIGSQTWLNWDREISDHADGNWRHLLYRAWARWEEDGFDLTVGRQRIALGRGRLWNPEDLFNPIFPLAIEGDQRVGQDAAVLRLRLRPGLWARAIVSPQDESREYRFAGRIDYQHALLDAGFMVGSFRRDFVVGADFATNLADAAFRSEVTYTSLDRGSHVWQAVASLDYNFDIGDGVYGLVEYLYNEHTVDSLDLAPPPPPLDASRLVRALALGRQPVLDRITTINEHQTGVSLSYEINPLLSASVLVLYDWKGASAAFAPSLSWSPLSDVVVSVAAQLFVGRDEADTEYGDTPGLLIVSFEAYF